MLRGVSGVLWFSSLDEIISRTGRIEHAKGCRPGLKRLLGHGVCTVGLFFHVVIAASGPTSPCVCSLITTFLFYHFVHVPVPSLTSAKYSVIGASMIPGSV